MILYLDTSALVKRYFEEPGSKDLIARWKQAEEIMTSTVAYAETMASFHRKKREADFDDAVFSRLLDAFRNDWQSFIRVDVTGDLNESLERLTAAYPLRGFDAIHLASALLFKQLLPGNFIFSCFDKRLLSAAHQEGVDTFPRIGDIE